MHEDFSSPTEASRSGVLEENYQVSLIYVYGTDGESSEVQKLTRAAEKL